MDTTEADSSAGVSCAAAYGSEVDLALLRAMRRNRELMNQYKRWPETVAALKKELAWGCEAFIENNEAGMVRLTARMMDNLEPLPEWGNPQNVKTQQPRNEAPDHE